MSSFGLKYHERSMNASGLEALERLDAEEAEGHAEQRRGELAEREARALLRLVVGLHDRAGLVELVELTGQFEDVLAELRRQ